MEAKALARPELEQPGQGWQRYGYGQPGRWPELLAARGAGGAVPRIDGRRVPLAEFRRRFEAPRRPCLIAGCTEGWAAHVRWRPEELARRFAEERFKVGTDDDGYAVRLRLKYFLHYCADAKQSRDDSPLYIFDGSFGDRDGMKGLLDDYAVPEYFSEDLMQHAGEGRRPPYRWFVWGPARSGSGIHVDPLATSAWNALISGRKRWVLFPPGTPVEMIKPSIPGVDKEAASWFAHVYPRTQRADWPANLRPLECVQQPGETMFVPNGWWHAVLNLDTAVAITQVRERDAPARMPARAPRPGRAFPVPRALTRGPTTPPGNAHRATRTTSAASTSRGAGSRPGRGGRRCPPRG